MPPAITLTVVKGKLTSQQYAFSDRTTCIMGRADDCSPCLPSDEHHKTISRHHCLLDINPPDIRIRDFGSRNGTFINGKKIGQRGEGMTPEEGAKITFPEFDLKEGDEIELGDTTFRVSIFVPAVCSECQAEIPEEKKAASEKAAGVYLCEACRSKPPVEIGTLHPPKKEKVCTQCGKDVSGEMGQDRQGDFVCARCKADPARIAQDMLEKSNLGEESLEPVRGYVILRELGRGGQGAVFLAEDTRSKEQVALKVMLPQVAANEHAKQNFLREVENTKALKHRNVVRLRDAGCWQGIFFFTLELCEGGSLDKLIKRQGGELPATEAVPLILQALDGLEYAHNVFAPGKGLVHRDLKPHNLFLAGTPPSPPSKGRAWGGVAKVGDYGLGKAFDMAGLSGMTRTGSVMGTPVFMPRQQVVNFKYAKPEVDVWAMAATLYNMLTGCYPRDFPRGKDPWMVVLQSDAVPIRQRDPSVPKKLAEVIDQALIDKPSISFKTAAEFKRALEQAL